MLQSNVKTMRQTTPNFCDLRKAELYPKMKKKISFTDLLQLSWELVSTVKKSWIWQTLSIMRSMLTHLFSCVLSLVLMHQVSFYHKSCEILMWGIQIKLDLCVRDLSNRNSGEVKF